MMTEDQYYTSICSAATLQSEKKGFFQSYADNVLELAGPKWLEEFRKLTSDTERLLKVYNDSKLYEAVHGVLQNVQPLFRGKAARLSLQRRMEGEKAAKDKKFERALVLLTQSVVRAPAPGVDCSVDDGFSLPLALWTRALTHLQLSEYHLSLADLQLSLKEKLPNKYRTEAYWYMAQCYQGMEEPERARVAFQVALKMLEPGDIELKVKIEKALRELPANTEQKPVEEASKINLMGGANSDLPGLSSAVTMHSAEDTGRYIVACQSISSGDVLAVESPHIACLLPNKFGSHCHHCFTRLRSAVACKECAGLAYCSVLCRDMGQSYHKYECHYMDLMIGSGMSILCHIALRTVTQQKYSYWKKVFNKQPVTPDYKRIERMVTHADKRQPADFVSRTLMALFLLQILEHSSYIPSSNCDDDKLTGMRLFLGSVLLHLLQCLQFNAHEIYETIYKEELDFTSSKINYIGVGVYTSAVLLNHDCYPAISRYFRGKDIVVRAVRPLKPGEMVAENYGPVYTLRTKAERQRSLCSRYWFNCNCTACCENWPKLTEMDEDILHFRCQKKDCNGVITTSRDQKKQKLKCGICSTNLNVAQTLLLLKSYDDDYARGLRLMSEGQLVEATQLFCAYSDIMHSICKPPIKNVSLAHEALRSCWAYPYNKYIVK